MCRDVNEAERIASPSLFRTVPIPTRYGLPFPKVGWLGVRTPPNLHNSILCCRALKIWESAEIGLTYDVKSICPYCAVCATIRVTRYTLFTLHSSTSHCSRDISSDPREGCWPARDCSTKTSFFACSTILESTFGVTAWMNFQWYRSLSKVYRWLRNYLFIILR